jgi:hypothetical protein
MWCAPVLSYTFNEVIHLPGTPLHADLCEELVALAEMSYRCCGCLCDIVDLDGRRSAIEAGAAEEQSASWVTPLGKRLAMIQMSDGLMRLPLRVGTNARSRVSESRKPVFVARDC